MATIKRAGAKDILIKGPEGRKIATIIRADADDILIEGP